MGEAAKRTQVSVEDYLKGEEIADVRHEYIDGAVFAMVGASKVHNLIAGNLYGLLRTALDSHPCRVFMSDVKVHVKTKAGERFYYPDLHVECEPFTDDSYHSEHPKLVVEILSDSTERSDRSEKFYAYRKLVSLDEYVLVAQDEPRVEVYRRSTGWELEIFGAKDSFCLNSVGAVMTVASVYVAVEL